MKPSVGRSVHYVSYGTPGGEFTSQCRAAVVTEVTDESRAHVSLAVLNPSGLFFDTDLIQSGTCSTPHGGSWHWPDLVE